MAFSSVFVARRYSGSSLRDARERVAGSRRRAGERGERGAFYRASIAPVREIARRRIPRSIARTSRSIRRGIRSRTRAMRRSSARAVGFRDGRRSKKTKKNKKKSVGQKKLPTVSFGCVHRVRGCIAVVDSLPRGARARDKSPRGVSSQLKAFVRSFVRRNQGMVYGGVAAHAPGRGLRVRRNSNS